MNLLQAESQLKSEVIFVTPAEFLEALKSWVKVAKFLIRKTNKITVKNFYNFQR